MHGRMLQTVDYNKEYQLGEKLFMTCIGEMADTEDFSNWAQANLRFYKTRNGYELDPLSTYHWLLRALLTTCAPKTSGR
uniref:Uncharacterized protein n=1 Tax=Ditylenchus dipsaci TaxID=166011 RepID=A0A915E1T1_9BILA